MPLLQATANSLSNDDLRAGVIEEIITSDQLFGLLPFKAVNGRSYRYNREDTLSEGDFVATGDVINEGAATVTEIVTAVKRIVGDVDVDDFLQETFSDTNDQTAVQLAKKAKGIGRKFARSLINGSETANAKEFDGLIELVTAAQTIYADGPGSALAALSFTLLDQLIDLVKTPGQLAFVMHSRTIRSYAVLCRAAGGTSPEQIGNLPGIVGNIIAYRGIPILKNDFIPTTRPASIGGAASTGTCCFLVSMDEEEGVCGILAGNEGGLHYKLVGPVQNKDATRHRMRWYTTLVLHSTLSLAMLDGISN